MIEYMVTTTDENGESETTFRDTLPGALDVYYHKVHSMNMNGKKGDSVRIDLLTTLMSTSR